MPFKELRALLVQVIISWQVLAVTIVVILYFYLVSYVADLNRRAKAPSIPKPPKMKRIRRKKQTENEEEIEDDSLGLDND